MFTCVLTRPSEVPGFYTFGYIDESLSNPGIQFNDIVTIGANAPGQWEIKSEYAVLNGIRITREGNTVAIDTGTPGILLEDSVVRNIYALLHGRFDTGLAELCISRQVDRVSDGYFAGRDDRYYLDSGRFLNWTTRCFRSGCWKYSEQKAVAIRCFRTFLDE